MFRIIQSITNWVINIFIQLAANLAKANSQAQAVRNWMWIHIAGLRCQILTLLEWDVFYSGMGISCMPYKASVQKLCWIRLRSWTWIMKIKGGKLWIKKYNFQSPEAKPFWIEFKAFFLSQVKIKNIMLWLDNWLILTQN